MSQDPISSTEAKAQLNRLLAEVRSGKSFTITSHGAPVARLVPIAAEPRRFGQLPGMFVPFDFNDALPADELAAWEGGTQA